MECIIPRCTYFEICPNFIDWISAFLLVVFALNFARRYSSVTWIKPQSVMWISCPNYFPSYRLHIFTSMMYNHYHVNAWNRIKDDDRSDRIHDSSSACPYHRCFYICISYWMKICWNTVPFRKRLKYSSGMIRDSQHDTSPRKSTTWSLE